MYSPRPPAPIAAAIVADPTPTTAATRMPADNRRQRQRQLDVPQQLASGHPHRDAGFADRPSMPLQSRDRGAHDRQQSVEDQHHERRARADAANERHRQQEAEHRQARHGLDQVRDADERRAQPRAPAPRRCRAARRPRRGDSVETTTSSTCWPSSADELGAVRRPEPDDVHRRQARRSTRTASSNRRTRGIRRRARFRAGGRERDQPSLLEDGDAIRQRQRLGHVVRDDDHGLPQAALDAAKLRVQLGAGDRIERAERLVHQQHRRIGRERPRHADALTLPAGQLVGPARRASTPAAVRPDRAVRAPAPRPIARRPSSPAVGTTADVVRDASCAETGRRPGSRSRSRGAAGSDPTRACRGPRPARARRPAAAAG